MEPIINNQPPIANQEQQPVAQTPISPTPPISQPVQPQAMPQNPPKHNGKGTILLILLLLLIIGISAYVIYAQNQINSMKKAATDYNTNTALPSSIPPAPDDEPTSASEIDVESPDADLKDVEIDVQGL